MMRMQATKQVDYECFAMPTKEQLEEYWKK